MSSIYTQESGFWDHVKTYSDVFYRSIYHRLFNAANILLPPPNQRDYVFTLLSAPTSYVDIAITLWVCVCVCVRGQSCNCYQPRPQVADSGTASRYGD